MSSYAHLSLAGQLVLSLKYPERSSPKDTFQPNIIPIYSTTLPSVSPSISPSVSPSTSSNVGMVLSHLGRDTPSDDQLKPLKEAFAAKRPDIAFHYLTLDSKM
jgi:hypothetical protein